ncbi:quinol:cytochrome c oxidoreductase iron-sulfur protein precursor [Lishizhenia tianjinensis]|uniref:Quinol:cytochrome c oxidoreductase iron-sulfur protein n=2 Tax=Lishizhenia TaxID=559293 RepID=A0A1I7B4E7_9FLAO|nr:TAT-variant-translocated molybdopterin oxidoreductase [Lishizhenia tianjinensis]SFT82049.1 quinol:cytochrome c oxidoreductase iron-sulfur protein precursor [Lishizhenia tianjinensis]
MATNRKYWKGLEELNETPEFLESRDKEFSNDITVDEFLADENLKETSTPRRDFLKFLGFSVAAATVAACEAPVTKAVPYVNKPVNVTPGMPTWYASTYYDGNSYASILVKTREGRPIFVKGNKDHGLSKGTVNPQIVGSVLPLYDSARLQNAKKNGENISTADADKEIKAELAKIAAKNGKVVLVSNTLASPSSYMAIQEFANSLGSTTEVGENGEVITKAGNFEHIQYDAVSYAGIRKANEASFGKAFIPDYDFSKADTVVSFGADFLSTWLLATQYTGQYGSRRNPDGNMNRHYQFESTMSITGSNADTRFMIKPSDEAGVLAYLIKALGGNAGVSATTPDSFNEKDTANLESLVKDLKKGNALIVSGSNNAGIQVLVNKLNELVGAYKSSINVNNTVDLFQSEDDKMMNFVKSVEAGKGPAAVIFYNTNPVYSLPNGEKFAAGLANVGLTISLNQYADETGSLCTYNVPDHHALEAWNDYSPKASEYAIAQPTIRPLHNTVAAQESFLVWAGKAERQGKDSKVFVDFIKATWKQYGFPQQTEFTDFGQYWNNAVHNSAVSAKVDGPTAVTVDASALAKFKNDLPKAGDLEVVLYQKAAIGIGVQANNPWLQEMPDTISKVTWDNYITMSPERMKEAGYNTTLDQEHGASLATITVGEQTLTLPVYPSPGQADGTVGIALGYGRGKGLTGDHIGKAAFQTKEYGGHVTDENGNPLPIGQNAFVLMAASMDRAVVGSIAMAEGTYPIASTQIHHTVMGRNSIIKETTYEGYKTLDKDAYNPDYTLMKIDDNGHHVEAPLEEFDLWDAHPVENVGHRWGMTIDLSSCFGCGSCLIACQAENNVPVVGKDEVRRGREMHWLRIDRYYASDEEATVGQRKDADTFSFGKAEIAAANPKVVHQPMMCHHCNHAPCETVCPVAATTHSNEGLNQMTYNRCIGTRYCANNCPYKVRRFNWFNYPSYKKFGQVNPAQDDLGRMVLNPDVTVRTRGVMEKCSFCVQKIQAGKLEAKKEGRPVMDGDVTTACADSCPADAIIVGDWNDVNSNIRKSADDKRAYQALEEIGVKPNIWYKVKVRNEENTELMNLQAAKAEKHEAGHGEDHGHEAGHDAHHEEAAH